MAAIADEEDPMDALECQDLLEGLDLTTLDEATIAVLYEELPEPDLFDGDPDFANGQ